VTLLKDALSLAAHLGRGRVHYRDGEEEAIADIRDIRKDGNYMVVGDALVPLHRITWVEVDGEEVWRRGTPGGVVGEGPAPPGGRPGQAGRRGRR
jgi:uncharacterized protein (UPF0248 family)